VPAPFGPARNGAVAFEQGGDLFIADQLDASPRTLISGPEPDGYPIFSNQGDRVAFVRDAGREFSVMSVLPDGSQERILAELSGEVDQIRWSPDGTALLVGHSPTDQTGLRVAVVRADGTRSEPLDVGMPADYASWRPDGRQILFRGHDLLAGTSSAYIADSDGRNVRRLPIETSQDVDFEGLGWSPDGKHISFMSNGTLGGTAGWQINIADIDLEGRLTDLRRLKLDPESTGEHLPVWSPDSTQVAFLLEKYSKRQVGIFKADGSDYRVVGPETWSSNILSYGWSPDGRTLLITEFPESELVREANRRTWSVDLATGRQTEVAIPVATWQRLAP
jgi:Tol biopolymer transport system component